MHLNLLCNKTIEEYCYNRVLNEKDRTSFREALALLEAARSCNNFRVKELICLNGKLTSIDFQRGASLKNSEEIQKSKHTLPSLWGYATLNLETNEGLMSFVRGAFKKLSQQIQILRERQESRKEISLKMGLDFLQFSGFSTFEQSF